MEKIKHSDLHLISGAWDSFGGYNSFDSLSCVDNTQLLRDLSDASIEGRIVGTGSSLLGTGTMKGVLAGGAVGAAAGIVSSILMEAYEHLPLNIEMPTVPMSPNWVNP